MTWDNEQRESFKDVIRGFKRQVDEKLNSNDRTTSGMNKQKIESML